ACASLASTAAERGTAWKRGVIVAASLVIAAAIGGGLAYGWRTFGGGAGEAGASPVIAAGSGPSKVAPEKPGGRQFANTDSKLLGRLDNGRGVPAAEDRSRSRVKPVAVLDVRPDGTIVPSARKPEPEAPATRAQPAPSGNNDIVVPGMTIVGVPQQTPQAAPAAPSTSTSGRAAPVQPRVLTTQPANPRIPQITNRADDRATEETRTASLGGTAPVINARTSDAGTGPVPLPSRNALPGRDQIAALPSAPAVTRAPQQQPAAPQTSNLSTGSSGANGYVAVLASQNSRIAALTAFADLRQRYGTVLNSAIPDVQKADLSSRGLGTMYRVVVGPPGSRAAANKTCSKLRTAGYTGCWVKAY
ncbi:MAG: SPOR domain-containing protein, partial [Pseudomonadota bacterium]